MYPYFRASYHLYKAKSKPKFEHPFTESQIDMRVWPWDIDMFLELNNGRYLTIMDVGRFEVGIRVGLMKILKKHDWSLMVGAVNGRYRRRLRTFEKFTLHSKMMYFDERWFYFHQWFTGKNGQMKASFLVRTAVISKEGLVPTDQVKEAMNFDNEIIDKHNHPNEWLDQWILSDNLHKDIMGS